MSKDNHAGWMISPKSFIGLLGAEYGLMRDAGLLKRFYISSLLIIIIMLLTWISIDHAINLLFKTILVEITLAIFFSLLFACIYIFLLNTFAKESRTNKKIVSASNIIRTGFIAFMGFIIAQPLMILLYASALSHPVENHKKQLLQKHTAQIDHLAKDELANLANRKAYCLDQKNKFGTSMYDKELSKIDSTENSIHLKARAFKSAAQQTISNNSFFLYQVEKTNRDYSLSWLLTTLIVVLFLLPGYLIYTISSQHEYYLLKKAREKKLAEDAYGIFTMYYKLLFNQQVQIFSRYEDPPFNTIRKQAPATASMSDFIKKYLGNG